MRRGAWIKARARRPMTLSSGYMYRTLRDVFAEYRGDPGRHTHVRFRRETARQLRGLLSEPEAVDLHKVNHEVWVVSSGACPRGKALDLALFEDAAVLGEM
jgi:hypothetical protein